MFLAWVAFQQSTTPHATSRDQHLPRSEKRAADDLAVVKDEEEPLPCLKRRRTEEQDELESDAKD
jgi:hypothetical protein